MKANGQTERILIVAKDEDLRTQIVDTLEHAGGYTTVEANNFEEALSEILLTDFGLIITEADLPDLSGMDLLAVIGGLRPKARVIVIDDDLSAKSALAVFRLGAVDYLYKPLNMTLMLMQVERQLETRKQVDEKPQPQEKPQHPPITRARANQLDPRTQPATLLLRRDQFQRIETELNRLLSDVSAGFAGLIDSDGNVIGASGKLDNEGPQLLANALNNDHPSQKSLANLLDQSKFHATYFESGESGVYIIEFGKPYTVSLAVICGTHIKPGMVWLCTKRTATMIDGILQTTS